MKNYKNIAMTAFVSTFLLSPLTSNAAFAASQKSCKIEGCKACKTISPRDFCYKHAIRKTFIISESGKYCLGDDIAFSPSELNSIAIIIDADHVQLDLCGHQLYQTNNEGGSVGILVKAGRDGVYIVNGSINNFTGGGIHFEEANDGIILDRLYLSGNGTLGGIFLGPVIPTTDPSQIGRYVSDVRMTNCIMEENAIGFTILGQDNILIENCTVNESLGIAAPTYAPFVGGGAYIAGIISDPTIYNPQQQEAAYVQNVKIYNSTFINGASGTAGLLMFSARNTHIKDSSFNNNTLLGGAAGVTAGFLSGGMVNALIENSEANNNSDTSAGDVYVSGFHFSANTASGLQASSGLVLRNCDAIENSGISAVSGFLLAYQNVIVENCRAIQNRCVQSIDGLAPSVAGFQLLSSATASGTGSAADDLEGSVSDSVFRNCIATQNVAENGPAAGFMWLGGSFKLNNNIQQNVSFIECVASGNTSLADSIVPPPFGSVVPGVAAGILIDRGVLFNLANSRIFTAGFFPSQEYRNVSISGCTLDGNEALSTNVTAQSLSGGLSLLSVDTATVRDSISMNNANGYVLSGGLSWSGILFEMTSHSIVENNTASSNVNAGFLDEQTNIPLQNAFIGNTALNNNPNYDFTGATISINNN